MGGRLFGDPWDDLFGDLYDDLFGDLYDDLEDDWYSYGYLDGLEEGDLYD